jgi:hypothetical protein
MRPTHSYLRAFATFLVAATLAAHAGDKPNYVKYVAPDGCDLLSTLQTLRQKFEGGGFYVFSEYTIEASAFGRHFGSLARSSFQATIVRLMVRYVSGVSAME